MENLLIVCLTFQQFWRQPAVCNMRLAQGKHVYHVYHVTDREVQSEGNVVRESDEVFVLT